VLDAIGGWDPDVVCLQEFRHGRTGDAILHALRESGLGDHAAPSTASASDNTVMVASVWPIEWRTFAAVEGSPVRALDIKIATGPEGGLRLLAVHSPQKKAQVPFGAEMVEWARTEAAGSAMVIGDLNNGVPFEDSETQSFVNTHQFTAMMRLGFIDAWRAQHGDAREYTWVSARTGNGFRYDHALVTPPLAERVVDVTYDHSVRTRRMSDHSLLVLDLA